MLLHAYRAVLLLRTVLRTVLCTLQVEDPTPNLQRVREKLEVEVLMADPWVAQQAQRVGGGIGKGGGARARGWRTLGGAAGPQGGWGGDGHRGGGGGGRCPVVRWDVLVADPWVAQQAHRVSDLGGRGWIGWEEGCVCKWWTLGWRSRQQVGVP